MVSGTVNSQVNTIVHLSALNEQSVFGFDSQGSRM